MVDLIILGAGTAGLSAAIYGVRAGLSVQIIESGLYGGQIVNSPDVDNYPGIASISGFDFVQNLHNHAAGLGVKIINDTIFDVELQSNVKKLISKKQVYEAKTVLLATGASHRKLGCPGEEEFAGRGVSYCATCDGAFFKGKDVAIAGGGNTALEDALFLSNNCNKVYLVHRREEFRAHRTVVEAVKARENIQLTLNYTVSEIRGTNAVESILLRHTAGGPDKELAVSGIFVAIGLDPNTKLFASQVELENGYVKAGENCHTNVPGVFVAGDVRTKDLRQLITAASDGAVAAVEAAKFLQ
ncbi:thioredoxin-disulfide reductase [Fumia xinanensis]|uniref:Thioredoxin reductase n=1 Tax=Fumia xinanensis TaxID=2763659 RepID=A0A926I6Q9_9FIRM|nr:thioredoxin-disulfide reductase [Fumia xinanensis]MBC8559244.1 thioredoxin-disulfide reductase [Fumia xinanensis]